MSWKWRHEVISCPSRNEAPIPTHFFVILTSCGNSTFSPVSCKGPLQAKAFILPHRPDHTESCAVSNSQPSPTPFCTSAYRCGNLPANPTMEEMIRVENFNRSPINRFFVCSAEWVGPDVGGGLGEISRCTSSRCRAPDGTQLLPRQVISGGDATAQDVPTHGSETLNTVLNPKEAILVGLHQLV